MLYPAYAIADSSQLGNYRWKGSNAAVLELSGGSINKQATIWQAAPPRRAQPNSFIAPAFDGQAMIEIPNLPLPTVCSLD